jgi:hypothetical protein
MMFAQKLRIVLTLAAVTIVVVVSVAMAADPVRIPVKGQTEATLDPKKESRFKGVEELVAKNPMVAAMELSASPR